MSPRDEFAKAALEVCVRLFYSDPSGPAEREETGWPWGDYDDMAESCYHIADAMMRARKPKKPVKTGAVRRRQ